ncbi:hypothetical protein [Ancylobacter oerskovii]|uniref:Uncharacterized protein n=1 Tax=Ancylobacter oerskovii TaxID=459519 RepID=A0ABW4YT40_9HYPH|nr:hypothetical protein [Ancylobacter oerskovii]MBS7543371.1 hypothetical protein [Ancylobacter oerskovii]
MQIQITRRPLPVSPPAPAPDARRSSPDWKPEPCGLTREQIRAIVIEQIG